MKRALSLAQLAEERGEVPVGALVVRNGVVIAEAFNEKEEKNNPCAHAEILAIQRAAMSLQKWRLNDCDLYVTLEPCTMCAGAIVQARLRKVIYGAADPKAGAVESVYRVLSDERLNHRPLIQKGPLSDECSTILKNFFQKRRSSPSIDNLNTWSNTLN